ncbi:hypothetical protein [Actinopolyspora halophila]|uniref:hypothetical protein n=1 Tax=Actinopolyspora halophila TaxID=1850 RepID=UPI00036B9E74|nr:hypothetical protein [Actinopolyspora halophila]
MARTQVAAQQTSATSGLAVTYEAANVDGNSLVNNGRRIALVRNGDSNDHTVTMVTGGTVHGLEITDPTVTVTAGSDAILGPFPGVFTQSDSGEVHLDYDAVTSVEIAVVEV